MAVKRRIWPDATACFSLSIVSSQPAGGCAGVDPSHSDQRKPCRDLGEHLDLPLYCGVERSVIECKFGASDVLTISPVIPLLTGNREVRFGITRGCFR